MSSVLPVRLPLEPLYAPQALFAVEILDAVTLERVTTISTSARQVCADTPIVN